jgi:hypothetical protein
LELPIDHFRLLGVGPSTDAQGALHMLQQRLSRVPDQGFGKETLEARADLLRCSADLLSDTDRRAAYEADLTTVVGAGQTVVPALDVPTSKEVGGLLLLLEAGQPLECFDLACRSLQPPQAPTLGSSREADLTLLAGLACLGAAEELHQQRRYEAAARTLQEGLQLLQRMGQLPELREAMNRELDRLAPYRVLDLLSRDLVAGEERREGLSLLEQLVQRRGGLEGDGDPGFKSEEFQPFFKQIRGYLTVQEQVDLFSRWGDGGSAAADFLASTALTASGFAQRKPERIAAARDRLRASGRSGIEPLLANLHLLLGEVDSARHCFEAGAGEELRAWAVRQNEDPLGQICAYCRDWLARDVLPGYRDLDAEADLEAYFSDRDVIGYIEREDRRTGRSSVPGSAFAAEAQPLFAGGTLAAGRGTSTPGGRSDFGAGFLSGDADGRPFARSSGVSRGPGFPADPPQQEEGEVELPIWRLPPLPWLAGGAAALLGLLLAGFWLLRPRPPAAPMLNRSREIPVRPAPSPVAPPVTAATGRPDAALRPNASAAAARAQPLVAPTPSAAQIQSLLESWLAIKTSVLAGAPAPAGLEKIARETQVQRLRSERQEDAALGQTQNLSIGVRSLAITERSPDRIAATAELSYSDSRRTRDGKLVERTAPKLLRNVYVFGRDGDSWRLAASRPAD